MRRPIKSIYCQKLISLVVTICFSLTGFTMPVAQAQDFNLPKPGMMVHLSPAFNSPILKGIKVHPDNPFRFDFVLEPGDNAPTEASAKEGYLKSESTRLIKYFLASITIPENDLWVNLSPYEKDRIVPESFGQTEMGRDLLAQDYMLKQITASLIYPEDEIGKKFWKRVYEEAQSKYGTTEVPVNTFNKVWIVPEKSVVYENDKAGTAYVVESRLKVMLEQDYLALEKNSLGLEIVSVSQTSKEEISGKGLASSFASNIVREIVIPELTKEINEGKNFAQLRQVYQSLILATWYKKKIKDSILSLVYADKSKVAGVNIDDPQEKEKIYQQYLQAFKKGAYNYIKEELDPISQQVVPRKYFSGGVEFKVSLSILETASPALVNDLNEMTDGSYKIEVNASPLEDIAQYTAGAHRAYEEAIGLTNNMITEGQFTQTEDDGIKVYISTQLQGAHAARKGVVYAPSLPQAQHELVELRGWMYVAERLGIATKDDIKKGRLGERLKTWANDTTIAENELINRQQRLMIISQRLHLEGLKEELKALELEQDNAEVGKVRSEIALKSSILIPKLEKPIKDFDITIAKGIERQTGLESIWEEPRFATPRKPGGKKSGDAESLTFKDLKSEYGFLTETHPLTEFVKGRLARIMPDIPEAERPEVYVLGKKGMGINAAVFPQGTVIVAPELLGFLRYEEELDGVLLHELNHTALKHQAILERTIKGGAILKSLGIQRYAEYEADAVAFYQMQESQRKTNPLGLLMLFERLRRDRNEESWDIAHGDITDRILNLKILTKAFDLAGINSSLTPLRGAFESGRFGEMVEMMSSSFHTKSHRMKDDSIEESKRVLESDKSLEKRIDNRVNPTMFQKILEEIAGKDIFDDKRILKELAEIVTDINLIQDELIRSSVINRFLYNIERFKLSPRRTALLIDALANNAEEVRELWDTFVIDSQLAQDIADGYQGIVKFSDFVRGIEKEDNPFNNQKHPPRDIGIENFIGMQREALRAFEDMLQNIDNEVDFLDAVDQFLQRWPVPLGFRASLLDMGNKNTLISKSNILQRGLDIVSKKGFRFQFLMSFFMEDFNIMLRMRERALGGLIEELPFNDAVDFAFERYSRQKMFVGLKVWKMLDEKAQNPEDFELLKSTVVKLRSDQSDLLNDAGKGVAGDAFIKMITESVDPDNLFRALVISQKNDGPLKRIVFNLWWSIYGEFVQQDMKTGKFEANSYDDLERWAQRKGFHTSFDSDNQVLFKKVGSMYISLDDFTKHFFNMGVMQRYILLRKLLSGKKGLLNTIKGRQLIVDSIFQASIDVKDNPQLSEEMRKVLLSLMNNASKDEVYLILAPLLQDLIGLPATNPKKWEDLDGLYDVTVEKLRKVVFHTNEDFEFIESEVDRKFQEGMLETVEPDFYDDVDFDDMDFEATKKAGAERDSKINGLVKDLIVRKLMQYIYAEDVPDDSVSLHMKEKEYQRLPVERDEARKKVSLTPMQLILESAKQLGAPGVRFLQLLGQTVELPNEMSKEFSQVYDGMQGQSKLAAWETIQNNLPDYAKRIKGVMRRLGGGSLFTVYEVEVLADKSDYPNQEGKLVREVVRVLNPNALYHARNSIDVIKDTMEELIEKNPHYAQALPLVELLEQWVEQELADPDFEIQDKEFKEHWHGTNPNNGVLLGSKPWKNSVYVPRSLATGTHLVRREEIVEGVVNLTAMDTLDKEHAKRAVALAAQFYIAQIAGDWSTVKGMGRAMSYVHSDVSPGNLGVMPSGDLVIFDRGLLLPFDREERMWLYQMAKGGTIEEQVRLFVNRLWDLPENKEIVTKLKKEDFIKQIVREAQGSSIDQQQMMIQLRVAVAKRNLKTPLKYTLLFKNFNAILNLCKQAGFQSMMEEALSYKPDKAMPQALIKRPKGGIDLRQGNWDFEIKQDEGQGIKFEIDPLMLEQLQKAPGFVPVIINIQPLKDLPLFLGITQDDASKLPA